MSNRINNETYKIKRKYSLSSTGERKPFLSSSASLETAAADDTTPVGSKFHVTKFQESIKHTQKYRIKWACDPNTGLTYSLNEIRRLGLIEREASRFRLPSTGETIDLDQAIRAGVVFAVLIDECLETLNQSFEFVQSDQTILNAKVI